MFTEKKLGVDPELLHYLFKHLGVHFESLRISATHVEGADGKLLPATTAAVDSGIQGGCRDHSRDPSVKLRSARSYTVEVIRLGYCY